MEVGFEPIHSDSKVNLVITNVTILRCLKQVLCVESYPLRGGEMTVLSGAAGA